MKIGHIRVRRDGIGNDALNDSALAGVWANRRWWVGEGGNGLIVL